MATLVTVVPFHSKYKPTPRAGRSIAMGREKRSPFGDPINAGYVQSAPLQVLETLHPTHLIAGYKGLVRPQVREGMVNEGRQAFGLVIEEAKRTPSGAKVVPVSEADFLETRLDWSAVPHRLELHREALRYAIMRHIGYGGVGELATGEGRREIYETLQKTVDMQMTRTWSCQSDIGDPGPNYEGAIVELAQVTLELKEGGWNAIDRVLYGTKIDRPKKSKTPEPVASVRGKSAF